MHGFYVAMRENEKLIGFVTNSYDVAGVDPETGSPDVQNPVTLSHVVLYHDTDEGLVPAKEFPAPMLIPARDLVFLGQKDEFEASYYESDDETDEESSFEDSDNS